MQEAKEQISRRRWHGEAFVGSVVKSGFCHNDQPAEADGHDTRTFLPAWLMVTLGVEVGGGKVRALVSTVSVPFSLMAT
jgi:hypothetical protein